MSEFDPNVFLDGVITEPFTRRPPLPPGDYVGVIGEIRFQSGQQRKDPSKTWHALNIPIEIDTNQSPGVRELVGQDKVILYDFVGLDLTESGMLDTAKGRNRQLGRYREALDMNARGVSFSPRAMQGRTILAKVKTGEFQGEIRDEIESVAKVG
jgi:hypothetical protein